MTSANEPTTPKAGSRLADVVGTIVLLVVHLLLYNATLMMLGLLVMGTDSCAYQKCGDRAWLDRAISVAIWGGGAILLFDVVVTLIRLIRGRVSWFVPLIGCVAQVGLGFGGAAMESLAGPL